MTCNAPNMCRTWCLGSTTNTTLFDNWWTGFLGNAGMGLVERIGGVSVPKGMIGDELLALRQSVECGKLSVVDGRT